MWEGREHGSVLSGNLGGRIGSRAERKGQRMSNVHEWRQTSHWMYQELQKRQ